jgi:iron complex outermembrane receptor protein
MRILKTILIASLFIATAFAAVSGTVTDAKTGEPLVGCNIHVEGTFEGTTSLNGGNYSLEANPGDVLVVSYIGYVTQKVLVEEGTTSIDISLKTDVLRQEGVAVVGSRFKSRTVITSPVPIDNLKIRELTSTGQNGLDHMLSYKVPSYNASQQTISDATAHFDPAELRGLGPSRTLVLVNGKRKHASSMIYINDTPGKGEVGVDMKSIPTAAIERVEVLRDGASAQYGSDAIAGVINVIMKEKVEYTEVNVTAGQTAGGHKNAGDGFNMGAT